MFETSPTASETQPLPISGGEKQDDGEECNGPLLPRTTTTTTRRRRRVHHKIAEDLEHHHHHRKTNTTLLTKKTESEEKNNAAEVMMTTKTKKKMRGSYEENDGDAVMMMQSDVEHQKSHSVLLEHAKELKENFQRWIHAIMERKDIAGMHHQSLYDAPPPRPPPAMMTKTTTRKKEDLQRRDQECRQQNSAPKGAFNENNNQGGGVGFLTLPRFKFLKLLPTIDKIAWDPRLKSFVMYFLCVLIMETKIAIVGVKQICPDEKRFLTSEMYSVYVKNMLMTFVPLQFAIDLAFLCLGVRKRIGARGKFEYDEEYEEKVYFWRQMIKTFLRHPQVTLALAGLYGPVSHEFSSVQFGAIVFMPLIIGKYSISRYSSLKYSFFYSIMATVYAFLFQFSAPEVREMWFENKFETFMDVTAKMYSRCSPQYMAFIFFTPLVMHLMYLVVNATGTSKKYINLSLATTAIVYDREKSRFDRVRFTGDEQNAEKEEVLEEEEEEEEEEEMPTLSPTRRKANDRRTTATPVVAVTRTVTRRRTRSQTNSPSSPARNNNNNSNYTGDNNFLEVLGFGIHLKSRSKRLRDSPPSSLNTSKDGSDGDVLDIGSTDLRSRQALSFIDVPNERYDYIGELCGRSVEEECTVMDGTHVVIHPPPPSTSGGRSESETSIFSAFKPALSARNILFPYTRKSGTYKRNAETIRLVDREFTQVLQKLKDLHSKSVVVSNNSNGELHDLSVRIEGKGNNVMSCSVWRGFTPDNMPIRAVAEKIKPIKCSFGVGRAKKTAYTDMRAGLPSGAVTNNDININALTVKSQSRFPHSYPRIISVSPMCVLPGVRTRIQIHGRSLKNITLCARLHGKADVEEIFMHSSDDQQNSEQKKSGSSIALFKLPLSKLRQTERARHAMWMKESDEMPLDASDEMEHYELEARKRREGGISLKNDNENSISSISDTSSDDEQIEQAPLETVYVDVCVDSLYDGGLFFLQFLNVPFASASIPIVVTPFLNIKRELDKKFSNRKLGDGARVVLFKSAEITGGRGMDWNIDEFANALEHDLGCPKYADLVRAAKSS